MKSLDSKMISFIIPILNEEQRILQNLSHYHFLRQLKSEHICSEVVFVDGGSTDRSREVLREHHFDVVSCEQGRSRQLNIGAQHSGGDTLIFLHADTLLPKCIVDFFPFILSAKWGFFKIALSNDALAYRIISLGINIRSKLFRQATGDQVIFFDRDLFFSMGAYADIPLMEDIEITRRAKKLYKPLVIQEPVVSSSRRWEKNGVVRTVFFMWFLQLCYVLGVSSDTLARWYYPGTYPRFKSSKKYK